MNYKMHYDLLITKSINRTLNEYHECHHIIPRCVNGSDDKSNLVNLTPEEHYIAHQLLVKIYPDNIKLKFALNMMCMGNSEQKRNNKKYGWVRRELSNALSQLHSGKKLSNEHISSIKKSNAGVGNYWYGKTWVDIYGEEIAKEMKEELSKRMSILNKGELNPMFGKTWEEQYGKDEADNRKKLQSNKRKGVSPDNKNKTLEESYGIEKANEIANKMSLAKKDKTWEDIFGAELAFEKKKAHINRIQGKTWEELYGKEKAEKMRQEAMRPKSIETRSKMSIARKLYWDKKRNS